MRWFRVLYCLLFSCLTFPALQPSPRAEGLFALFETNMGSFRLQLDYQRAPRTVANFVSLAEGGRDWLDYPRASMVRRPYFNGLTFHRVVEGFVIQGGSPNGQGTDGPGYQFRDEFHPELRHNKAGILSMANSGPDSNGSQFFVTLNPTPTLDDLHSVFGEVVDGMETVQAIGLSPVSSDGRHRPLQPVIIHSVQIQRQGPGARFFGESSLSQPLPSVRYAQSSVIWGNGKLEVLWENKPGHSYGLFYTSNFREWNYAHIGGFAGVDLTDTRPAVPALFFISVEIQND
jgi:peptidyl-prolyl cis-trans isomerase A (cyclophilin A)